MAYEKTAKKGAKIGVLVGILAVVAAGYLGYSAVHIVDAGELHTLSQRGMVGRRLTYKVLVA